MWITRHCKALRCSLRGLEQEGGAVVNAIAPFVLPKFSFKTRRRAGAPVSGSGRGKLPG